MDAKVFPGREYRGFIKAEKPLKLKRRKKDTPIRLEDLEKPKKKINLFEESENDISEVSESSVSRKNSSEESDEERVVFEKKRQPRSLFIDSRSRQFSNTDKKKTVTEQPFKVQVDSGEEFDSDQKELKEKYSKETIGTEESSTEKFSTDYSEDDDETDSLLEEHSSIIDIPDDFNIPDFWYKTTKIKEDRKGRKVLHKLFIERLQLDPFSTQTLGLILALWMGIGYAVSTQIRCICFLTIPAFCGKTGRAYISTFVVTSIITGPIANILSNANESTRVISCVASLNVNHTVQRFKLMFKPVKEIVWDFVGAGNKVKEGTKEVEGSFKEIEKEVRDEDEVKKEIAETQQLDEELGQESRVTKVKKKFSKVKDKFGAAAESKYAMKSEFRCQGIFTKGVKGCYNSFGAAYDRCHSYLPIVGYLLCWPMKLTFICDIAGAFMGKRTCDSKDALSPGFGESIDTAEGVQKEFDKGFGVKVHYKLKVPFEKVDFITPQDVSQAMKYQFNKRRRTLEFFLNMMTRILAFSFLFVFNVSRVYCDQYLRVIQYDNKYITSYFRHIDARRFKQGKMTLLPLKKGEKIELLEPFKMRFSAEEKVVIVMTALRLAGEVLTVSIILTFDWIFYEFLMLIQRHSHVTYYQTGMHHIKMTVYGDGFIGTMVRSILKGFDKKHTLDEITTTAECLPQPQKLSIYSILMLYSLFLLIFLLKLIESYALRLRRIICSFFYPKREKKRILYLYNDRLKKRKSYMRFMRHRVRKLARDQAIALDSGVLTSLRYLYPKYFEWLGKLGLGKRKCLVCEEVESRRTPFIVCSDECPFSYCPECWRDMEGKCYVCLPDDDEDSPLSDESCDEDNEDDL